MSLPVCKVRSYYSLSRDDNFTLITVGGHPNRQWYSEIAHSLKDDKEMAKSILMAQQSCDAAAEHAQTEEKAQ